MPDELAQPTEQLYESRKLHAAHPFEWSRQGLGRRGKRGEVRDGQLGEDGLREVSQLWNSDEDGQLAIIGRVSVREDTDLYSPLRKAPMQSSRAHRRRYTTRPRCSGS